MIAYFDTQTFDHIYKKIGCTGADIANLRKAIYGRQLSIRLSIHTLEEILLGRKVSPQALAAQIKLTLSLASSRMLVKPCAQLLFDDIRAYAAQGEADRPFLRGDMQNAIADGIAAIVETDGEELEEELLSVLEQTRQDKQEFMAALEQASQPALANSSTQSGYSSFEHYFDATAQPALEILATRAGVVDRCRQRGINGLLQINSVRVSLAASLAPRFGARSTTAANSTPVHHAVSAAAVAETYVSETASNRELFSLLGFEGLRVTTLAEFLNSL